MNPYRDPPPSREVTKPTWSWKRLGRLFCLLIGKCHYNNCVLTPPFDVDDHYSDNLTLSHKERTVYHECGICGDLVKFRNEMYPYLTINHLHMVPCRYCGRELQENRGHIFHGEGLAPTTKSYFQD